MNIKLEEHGYFSGYAAIFNNPDQENDIFLKGCFLDDQNKINPSDIKLLWQHDPAQILGLYEEIYEDDHGLFVKGKLLLDIVKSQEVYTMLKNKAVNGLSVGFTVQDFYYDDSGFRVVKKAKLWEISLVTFPANKMAKIDNIKGINFNQHWSVLIKEINSAKNNF